MRERQPELTMVMDECIPAHPASTALLSIHGTVRTAIWLLGLNCLQNLALAPRATVGAVVAGQPCVSILVPARDEAANIAECLRSLLAQRYPADEILVLDDHSTDNTAAIVQSIAAEQGGGRLRLLPGRERPEGWTGKNWACHQLSEAARGDWFLFTDADTRHEPDSLAAALALAQRYDADLVSLLPRQVTATLGERLLVSQLPLIIYAFLPLALVPRRDRWAKAFAGAFGPYLFFRRTWYEHLGGFAAVRGLFSEDMQFAVATKRRGGRLVLADGAAVLSCRMYRGFADAWRGMTRNALPAALGSPVIFWAFALAWAAIFALPPATVLGLFVRQLVGQTTMPTPLARLALAATGGQLALRLAIGQRHRWPLGELALQPLSAFLTLAMLADSYRRHRTGAVTWRGRRYP
jgi:chlorobactene glucosyltransferase